MLREIHKEVTDHTASIWWDPAQKEEDVLVAFHGRQKIAVNSHVEFDSLDADTDYTFTLDDVNFSFHTLPEKKRLDITKKPYFCKPNEVCTASLQKAFDDCDETSTVYLPAGVFLSGAINMHSHSSLYLEKGAVLQGSEDPADYEPRILSRFEGTERMCYRSLLNLGTLDHTSGPNCTDVLIYGHGEIRGGGSALAKNCAAIEKENIKEYLASHPEEVASCEKEETIPFRCRGRLINMSNCDNVRITGLTLGYGPSWNIHFIYSSNIITDHCLIQSDGVWNGDGWDPDSSTRCALYACTFSTGDDAVAIKSGKNPQGNEIHRPIKQIRVFDCRSVYGHGICIGSEMSGGVEDVIIADCDLKNSECGIEIKATKKRGGYVKNIKVYRCITPRVQIHPVGFNDDGIPAETVPVLENFLFDSLKITGSYLNYDHTWQPCSAITAHGISKDSILHHCIFQHTTITQNNDLPKEVIENCEGYQNI